MPKKKPQPYSNPRAVIRRAIQNCRKADALSEEVHMDLSNLYWVVKAGIDVPSDPDVLRRLDTATTVLSDARQSFGDAVHQLEQILK